MTTRFTRYQLRSTDAVAARGFYQRLLGDGELEIVPLPAQAAARGAPAHWLAHLGVVDVPATLAAFQERGGSQLGPLSRHADTEVAVVRDPGGTVVALETRRAQRVAARPEVSWVHLESSDLALAGACYHELFGWQLGPSTEFGELGPHRPFSFEPGGPLVGSMSDITTRPQVHAQWLLHFTVADFERAVAFVREASGLVFGTYELPDGVHFAICDDAQGAAFALRSR